MEDVAPAELVRVALPQLEVKVTVSDFPFSEPPEKLVVMLPLVGKQHPLEYPKAEVMLEVAVICKILCCTATDPDDTILLAPLPETAIGLLVETVKSNLVPLIFPIQFIPPIEMERLLEQPEEPHVTVVPPVFEAA